MSFLGSYPYSQPAQERAGSTWDIPGFKNARGLETGEGLGDSLPRKCGAGLWQLGSHAQPLSLPAGPAQHPRDRPWFSFPASRGAPSNFWHCHATRLGSFRALISLSQSAWPAQLFQACSPSLYLPAQTWAWQAADPAPARHSLGSRLGTQPPCSRGPSEGSLPARLPPTPTPQPVSPCHPAWPPGASCIIKTPTF